MIARADARHLPLPDGVAQTVVTSPPYWGLRRYGDDEDELGTEDLKVYIDNITEAMAEVRRILRPDGLLWLNIGDTASGSGGAGGDYYPPELRAPARDPRSRARRSKSGHNVYRQGQADLAPRQWCNVPARVSIALQDDGWRLRASITWAKTSRNGKAMTRPESLRHVNRPGVSSEMIYLLAPGPGRARFYPSLLAERGDVWHFQPVRGKAGNGHAAPFPDELARRCILPSTLPGDLVVDPFAGSGTTLRVARHHGRRAVGFDLYAGR